MDIALSTDSKLLTEMLLKAAPEIFVIDRDASLAGDLVRKIDVIRDAAKRAETRFGGEYGMVVDLDLTSPLRTLADLEAIVEKRKAVPADTDVIYTMTEARRRYLNMVEKKGAYYDRVIQSTFATRQEAPPLYDMNASIYAYSRAFIYDENPFFNRVDIVVMRDTGILDIDSMWDYELMQGIAGYLYGGDEQHEQVREGVSTLCMSDPVEGVLGGPLKSEYGYPNSVLGKLPHKEQ